MSDAHRGTPSRTQWRGRIALGGLAVVLAAVAAVTAESPSGTPEEASQVMPAGLRTIVIDPGHGGSATGTTAGSIYEKELTLDVSLRLRDLILRRLGLQVVLTREDDIDVPLDERTEKANYWKADLFLSIHANAYRSGEIRGPETYFLSDRASDARARAVAASENGPAPEPAVDAPVEDPASDPSLQFILWDLAQTAHLRESSMLAEMMQADLNGLFGLGDRGVKQAPFRVLKGATMPAVLVEIGYLSSPADAELLLDPSFRQEIAESLYRSITLFRERYAVLAGPPPAP